MFDAARRPCRPITTVAELITCGFFSVRVLVGDYSYSRGGGMELISDTVTAVVVARD